MGMVAVLWSLGIVLALVGIAGTVLPVLPGPPLVYAGLFLAAWAEGFGRVGWFTLTGLGLLTLLTIGIDLASASLGTKGMRASPWAAVGAAVGTVVGLFFGFVGVFVVPFIGAVAGEYWARRDLKQAGKVGVAAWVGLIVGSVMKVVIVFVMLGWFTTALFV